MRVEDVESVGEVSVSGRDFPYNYEPSLVLRGLRDSGLRRAWLESSGSPSVFLRLPGSFVPAGCFVEDIDQLPVSVVVVEGALGGFPLVLDLFRCSGWLVSALPHQEGCWVAYRHQRLLDSA